MGWIILILLGTALAVYPQALSRRFNIAPLAAGTPVPSLIPSSRRFVGTVHRASWIEA